MQLKVINSAMDTKKQYAMLFKKDKKNPGRLKTPSLVFGVLIIHYKNGNKVFNSPVFFPIDDTTDIKQYFYTLVWVTSDKLSHYVKHSTSNHSKKHLPTMFNNQS